MTTEPIGDASASGSAERVSVRAGARSQLRVLVVDDDSVDRIAIRRVLQALAFSVESEEVDDAEAAIRALATGRFDCALLDYQLPEADGLTVLRRVRDAGVDTPIIVLTGHGDAELAVELMKAGAADYVPKNALSVERIERSLESAIRVHRAEAEARAAEMRLRRNAAQLRGLTEAAVAINGLLDAEEIFRATAAHALAILSADRVVLLLAETLQSPLSLAAQSFEGLVPNADNVSAVGRIPSISAPVLASDKRELGVLTAWRSSSTEGDEAILAQLSHIASVALENARLFRVAQDSARARDDMLAVVSHDLRNPVHTMLLASSFLLEIAPSTDRRSVARSQLEVIQRSARHATRLIADLLDVSRMESGKLRLDWKEVRLRLLAKEAIDAHAGIAALAGLSINLADEPEGEPLVVVDHDRILQVLANLLGNAIKFTPKGGAITLRMALVPNAFRFEVSDTGAGIAPENLPRVFDRFWQGGVGRSGAGLGLAIAKGIVEAHGGRIEIASTVATGTAVVFTVPVQPA